MSMPQPLHLSEYSVESDWIDYNGHMNVGYYGVAFDRAGDVFIDGLGMDADYRQRSKCSVYVLETRTAFLRELKQEERFAVDLQLLDFDNKRLHYFLRMLSGGNAAVCAWSEIMLMHMDMNTVSGTPMPVEVLARVRQLAQAHSELPRPGRLSQALGIRR